MTKTKTKSEWGTKEWSPNTLNCITGCINDCKYCYAKEMSIRYNRNTPETWKVEEVRDQDLKKKIKKYDARVMYPSAHDIRPEHLQENMEFLKHILEVGNEVLIVSKPHLVCIKKICKQFADYKDKILFRFSIGSADDTVLKFWEPNAPGFKERLACLNWAFKKGFGTSVSCEPMLDNGIDKVVKKVSPYVTETIWIGKINHLIGVTGRGRLDFNGHNNPETLEKAHELITWQSDENILKLYEKYKLDSKILWKESIKKVIERIKGKNE
jgi:DNA repair photolyase